MHPPLPPAQSLSKQLQHHHEEQRPKRNSRLDPQCPGRPHATDPVNLNIRGHKPSPVPTGRHPRAHLAGSLGVAVKQVCVDGGRDDHHTAALHGCENGNDHVMPVALKGEPQHDQTDAAEDSSGIDDDQACFGV